VPVVSAVGHEQDTPLCDLAADVRASTPTAAGKLVVPELSQLSGKLDRLREALARSVRRTLERDAQALERSAERLRAAPHLTLERQGQRVERAHERLRQAPALAVERKRAALESTAGRLRVLSSVKTLQRGYAIVSDGVEGRDGPRGRAPPAHMCAGARRRWVVRCRRGRGRALTAARADVRGLRSAELEQIVTRLEQGQVSLDETLALWERGESLYGLLPGEARLGLRARSRS
jgi:exodeoxyribonuclease VII large subunit